jgi:uncharacterized protein with GYD domain
VTGAVRPSIQHAEVSMSFYMLQWSYKDQQVAALVQHPHDRYEVVSKLLKDHGGTLHSFFLSFGDYDGVAITEFPDNTAATACLLTILRSGAVSQLKTTVLISPKEALRAMKLASETKTSYLPPTAGLAD